MTIIWLQANRHFSLYIYQQNKLQTTLFRKPSHRLNFFNAKRNHPYPLKKSIPYSQALRILLICSTFQDYHNHSRKLIKQFVDKGYKKDVIIQKIQKGDHLDQRQMLNQRKRNEKQCIPLSVTHSQTLSNLKDSLTKHWHILQANQINHLFRVLVILFQMMILKALTRIWWNSKIDQRWNNMSKTSQSNGVSIFGIASKTGYLYQLDLHLGKKSSDENLLRGVVLKTTESFQSCHCMGFFLIISSTVLHLQWSFMKKICMVLAIPKKTGMKCRRYLLTERLREVVLSTCISTNSWTGIQ